MPPFDPGHADGIRHADLDAGERILKDLIYECERSLQGIEHAKLDLDARSWARGQGLRELTSHATPNPPSSRAVVGRVWRSSGITTVADRAEPAQHGHVDVSLHRLHVAVEEHELRDARVPAAELPSALIVW